MKFCYGGALSNKAYIYHDALVRAGANFTLGSYWYFKDNPEHHCAWYVLTGSERDCPNTMERIKSKKPKIKMMLDSGAFSAWKRGTTIDVNDYIAYIKKNQHLLYSYVNLDVIPGVPGRKATQAEVESAAKASYKNLKLMHKAGLSPIPVFHYGEDFKWLQQLLDDEESYIGLGGLVGQPQPDQIAFLDHVFTMLTDSMGQPLVKTHGFGVASFPLLKRYPWTTCDATSWAMTAAMGGIYVPVFKGTAPDYSQAPVKLTVSEVERSNGAPADHYQRLGRLAKDRVEMFLKEVGVTVADVVSSYEARGVAIVYFMLKFQDAIGEQPFRYRLRGLR